MGKGGLFLTFLTFVVLLGGGWYLLGPGDVETPNPPGEPPGESGADSESADPPPDDPAAVRTLHVSGLVLERGTDRPISGARVRFRPEDQEHKGQVSLSDGGVTDAKGEWRTTFRFSPADLRVSSFVSPLDAYAWISAEGFLPQRFQVRVNHGETRISLAPARLSRAAARVSGYVRFPDGKPVSGAVVGTSVTDETGRYGPIPVFGGETVLSAVKDGWPTGTARFTVDPGPMRDVEQDIYLPVSMPFSGLVVDTEGGPLPGVTVRLGASASQVTGEDGAFSFPGLTGEFRRLEVTREGWRPASVRIQAGRPLTVRLPRGGVLAGFVRMADGSPSGKGYTVYLRGRFEALGLFSAPVDAAGRFRMTLPAGGAVEIEIRGESGPCGAFVAEVAKGETVTREFTLEAPRMFPVRVVSAETEAPVAGATIFGGWPGPVATQTDEGGLASVPFPPVRVPIPTLGYVVAHKEFLPGFVTLDRAALSRGELTTFRLLPRSAIRAIVLDPDGNPVAGATVQVHLKEPSRRFGSVTGADGRAEVDAPAGRLVRVTAFVRNLGTAVTNATAPADVTLRPANPRPPDERTIRVLTPDDEPQAGAWVQGNNRKPYPVGADGRVTVPGSFDWVHVMAPGRSTVILDLDAVERGEEAVVRLDPGRDVVVEVSDSAGRPVGNVFVRVHAERTPSVHVPSAWTSNNGKALLRGLPPDLAVFVGATIHGFSPARAWVAAGARATSLRLTRWGEAHVHLGGSGLRAGQPISWRWRTLDRAPLDEEAGVSGTRRVPDNSGTVRITVPTGRLALLVECAGAAPRIFPEVLVTEDRPGKVTYDFPESGRLRVTVRDEDDNYIEAARLFVPGIDWHFAWTTSRGRIPPEKRARVPVGRLRLAVAAEGYATVWTDPIDFGAAEERTIVLPLGVEVEGRLVTGDGRPVPGQIRVLTHVDQPDRTDEADEDGTFRLARRLAPGEHRLWIQGRGFPPVIRTIRIDAGAKNRVELAVE